MTDAASAVRADDRDSRALPGAVRRVRLKADGRIVEVLPDGGERAMTGALAWPVDGAQPGPMAATISGKSAEDAAYAKRIRARTNLTQAEFAARIGVPLETVRNWEQGKRVPRGPARALLKVLDHAPLVAFAALSRQRSGP